MTSTLLTLLQILSRVDVEQLTDRFIELYELVVQTLTPQDQETARAALKDRQLDNDEGHARLQARLAQAASL